MRLPLNCLDERLEKYMSHYRHCFSQPQYKYFVIILLGLMLCQGSSTLSGLLNQVEKSVSVSGTSRFLSSAPWSAGKVSQTWLKLFQVELVREVRAEHARRRAKRPKKGKGSRKKTAVTGYLIGDDSVMHKVRGKKMGGLGHHYSNTAKKTVPGHSLVESMYVLLGRRCPLEPKMYRQKAVCEKENVTFQSKIDIMIDIIRTFTPVEDTVKHVLLDSWYGAKKVWKAARDRGFLITTGLRCNRWLRIDDPDPDSKKWHWQKFSDYAAQLKEDDFKRVLWPSTTGKHWVYVHVVTTRVRKLYKCQLILVRETLDGETRFWASNDLQADTKTLLTHIATRWQIEVLFADTKELFGLDNYQLMDANAILRFWTLVMAAYFFLELERNRLQLESSNHTTIGDACRYTRRVHWGHFLHHLYHLFTHQGAKPDDLYENLIL